MIIVTKLHQIICKNAGCPIKLALSACGHKVVAVGRSYIELADAVRFYDTPPNVEDLIVQLNNWRLNGVEFELNELSFDLVPAVLGEDDGLD